MAETQPRSVWNQLRRSRTGLAITTLGLVVGCGPRIDAAGHDITTCDQTSSVFEVGSTKPITSKDAFLKQLQDDASALHQRAVGAGLHAIDLPDHNNVEIHAGPEQLELSYPSRDSLSFGQTSNIYIHFVKGQPQIAVGAFVCSQTGGIFENLAASDLHHYVAETSNLAN